MNSNLAEEVPGRISINLDDSSKFVTSSAKNPLLGLPSALMHRKSENLISAFVIFQHKP
jgi:hypothetical protein